MSAEKPWDIMRKTAWANLTAAINLPETADEATRRTISDLCLTYARASGMKWADTKADTAPRRTASGERSAVAGDGPTVFPPFGRAKGQPIKGAALDTLRFYERCCVENLDNPDKAKWHHKEQKLLDAVRDELRRQGHAGNHE